MPPTILQCTLPFEGLRFTLIYWSHTLTNTLQPADREFLASPEIGFDLGEGQTGGDRQPPLAQRDAGYPSRAERMAAGEAAFAEWERSQAGGQSAIANADHGLSNA